MSITRAIEIWKKDQRETDVYDNRWVGWKDTYLDGWITLYLFYVVDRSMLRWIRSDDDVCEIEVPKEIFMDMAERLLSRQYDLKYLEYDLLETKRDMEYLEEARPGYIEGFAKGLKRLVMEVGEDEIMVYIDAGN